MVCKLTYWLKIIMKLSLFIDNLYSYILKYNFFLLVLTPERKWIGGGFIGEIVGHNVLLATGRNLLQFTKKLEYRRKKGLPVRSRTSGAYSYIWVGVNQSGSESASIFESNYNFLNCVNSNIVLICTYYSQGVPYNCRFYNREKEISIEEVNRFHQTNK